MATTIQVVLQHDVENVGTSGELVKVRPGFARNYLLPRQLAVPATTAQVNRINHEKAVALAQHEKRKKEASGHADHIKTLHLKIGRKAGDDDKLFGSVTLKEIEQAALAAGAKIERKMLHLADPLKSLGIFEIPVKLMKDIATTLKVEIHKAEDAVASVTGGKKADTKKADKADKKADQAAKSDKAGKADKK